MIRLEPIKKETLKVIKNDFNRAESIWKDIFLEFFGDNIKYLFKKGSTNKGLTFKIDYVPILSDLDLHFAFTDDRSIEFFFSDPVKGSLEIAKEYHDRFISELYFHIPRMQVMDITKLKNDVDFVPSPKDDVTILLGDYNPNESQYSNEDIRKLDAKQLTNLDGFVERLPRSYLDRSVWIIGRCYDR